MPIMQGPEVLDTIHQENLTFCPIVMMTTENSPAFIVKALSKGASEYIMKPFTEEIINEKILMVTKGAA
jgi:CheY-like chemotaxis protein